MKTEIGIAIINYNESGTVASATFKPTIELNAPEELLKTLQTIIAKDEQALAANAKKIFATWFEKTNQIELADQEEFHIATEIVTCENYPNGAIRRCEIKFVFQNIT